MDDQLTMGVNVRVKMCVQKWTKTNLNINFRDKVGINPKYYDKVLLLLLCIQKKNQYYYYTYKILLLCIQNIINSNIKKNHVTGFMRDILKLQIK